MKQIFLWVCVLLWVEYLSAQSVLKTRPFDVIINELMVNPLKGELFPDAEYVEIYNRSRFLIVMDGWFLQKGSKKESIPKTKLAPYQYAILVKKGKAASFPQDIFSIELSSFSALNNSGGELRLLNDQEEIMDQINYSNTWWGSSFKRKGGWSLERIDPFNVANRSDNWKVAMNEKGGTPGEINSVDGSNPDTIAPKIDRFVLENNTLLTLFFSEYIDENMALNKWNYKWNSPVSDFEIDYNYSSVSLSLHEPLTKKIVYKLNLSYIQDLAGNALDTNFSNIYLGVPEAIDKGDIKINEIMFNPSSSGSDYIEIFNSSQKIIDVQELAFARLDDLDALPTDSWKLSDESLLIMPGAYLLFEDLHRPLPPLPDDEAYVALLLNEGVRDYIDVIYYNEKMHSAYLDHLEGVALERISSERSALDASNWQSASFSSGYGTPGFPNSQNSDTKLNASNQVSLGNKFFTPDGDGRDDYLEVLFNLDEPGWLATVQIYDMKGKQQMLLCNNRLVVNNDVLLWKGAGEEGNLLPVGIYIVYVKLFKQQGRVEEFKLPVALY